MKLKSVKKTWIRGLEVKKSLRSIEKLDESMGILNIYWES